VTPLRTFTATVQRIGRCTWRVEILCNDPGGGSWIPSRHSTLCWTRRGARWRARRMLARARRQERYRVLEPEAVDL
jgi:hypothetical protein